MINFKLSFTNCEFTEEQLDEWIVWVATNIAVEAINKEEIYAVDAKNHSRPA